MNHPTRAFSKRICAALARALATLVLSAALLAGSTAAWASPGYQYSILYYPPAGAGLCDWALNNKDQVAYVLTSPGTDPTNGLMAVQFDVHFYDPTKSPATDTIIHRAWAYYVNGVADYTSTGNAGVPVCGGGGGDAESLALNDAGLLHIEVWASPATTLGNWQDVIIDAAKSTPATATTDPVPVIAAQSVIAGGPLSMGGYLSATGLLPAIYAPYYLGNSTVGLATLQPPTGGPVTGLSYSFFPFPANYPFNWNVSGAFGNPIPTVDPTGRVTAFLRSTAGQPTLADLPAGSSAITYTPVGDPSWLTDGKVSANGRGLLAFRTMGPNPGFSPGLLRIVQVSVDRQTTRVLADGTTMTAINDTGGRAIRLNDLGEVFFAGGSSLWSVNADGYAVNVWAQYSQGDASDIAVDINTGLKYDLSMGSFGNLGHTPPEIEDSANNKGSVLFGLNGILVLATPQAGLRASRPLLPTTQDPVTGLMTFTGACQSIYSSHAWMTAANLTPTNAFTGLCYVDPPPVGGYTFTAAAGADNFQSVLVPTPLPQGQSTFTVAYGNTTATLTAGQTYTFPAGGVASFMILGINAAEALSQSDPRAFVVGLGWVNNGASPTDFTMLPLVESGPTITPAITGTLGANSWYRGNVSLTWTVSDPLSPVISQSGCGAASVTSDTAGQSFTCTASSAGGTTTQTVTIKRDATAPIATATPSPLPNSSGWNNGNVQVSFSGSDALSGIASCSLAVTMSAEAASQSSPTGTCTDGAGNTSVPVSATGINIDKTAPLVTATSSPAANANGWNNTSVTVTYTASDVLSGVPANGCDAPTVLTSDGAGQSATGHCSDRAGNSGAATASGINIDKTPPTATATRTPGPNANGWNNTPVTVSFSGTDSLNGSGIAACSPSVVLGEGAGQVASGTCTDKAGNVSPPAVVTGVNVDLTAPTASISVPANGASYAFGAVVNASYSCTDALSGVAVAQCVGTIANGSPIDTSTAGSKSFSVTATDRAGNVGAAVTVSYTVPPAPDTTPPVIVPTITGTRGSNGWHVSDVVVSWQVTDPESAITSTSGCGTTTVTRDTRGVTLTCTATSAGGTSSQSVTIKRGAHRPLLEVDEPRRGKTYTVGQSVKAAFECDDYASGIATCAGTVNSQQDLDTATAGTKTFTLQAIDAAGLSRSVTFTYKVQ